MSLLFIEIKNAKNKKESILMFGGGVWGMPWRTFTAGGFPSCLASVHLPLSSLSTRADQGAGFAWLPGLGRLWFGRRGCVFGVSKSKREKVCHGGGKLKGGQGEKGI
jgi:hypothetical protein